MDQCKETYPDIPQIRCQLSEGHQGNHRATGGIVDKVIRHLFHNDAVDGWVEWQEAANGRDHHKR